MISGLEHIVRENEPLAPYTRLGLGGVAEYFAEPTSQDELVAVVKRFTEEGLPIRLIGGGSNVLIKSSGVAGLVIHLGAPAFCEINVSGQSITAGGGTKLSHFVSTAVREGFSGPQRLVGIPGTIGGALHGNSGAHSVDIGTWVESATVLTRSGEVISRGKDELSFSYRQSSLSELAILNASFKFESEDAADLTKQMQKLWVVRRNNQPATDEPAAYVFKDHGSESAGSLIDAAGLKGTQVGAVEVFDHNPNYFVARNGATTDDVLRLIELVKSTVAERISVELETAIQVW